MKLREYHQKVRETLAGMLSQEDGLVFSSLGTKTRDYYLAAADRLIKDVAASVSAEELVRATELPGEGEEPKR